MRTDDDEFVQLKRGKQKLRDFLTAYDSAKIRAVAAGMRMDATAGTILMQKAELGK